MPDKIKHVVLDKVRGTLNLIRKSNVGFLQDEQGNYNLVSKLKQLQNSLRSDSDQHDVFGFVSPFVAILHSPYLAGPFKLAALDAIESFITLDIPLNDPANKEDIIRNIVNAVARCKFVQTDIVGDELVQLSIINVLFCLVKSNSRFQLTEVTAMEIIESCQSMMFHAADEKNLHIYQAAERTILELVRFIFSQENASSSTIGAALRLASFFVDILGKHCSSIYYDGNSTKSTSSAPNSTRRYLTFGDISMDQESSEVVFALKAIHAMLLSNGNVDVTRKLILCSPQLLAVFRNDVGRRLVMLCGRRDLPAYVLQVALSVFTALLFILGPSLRVAVECFLKYIFIRALVQLRSQFANYDEAMRLSSEVQAAGGSAASGTSSSSNRLRPEVPGFTIDELEIILQCLCDLLSDTSFLPMLFVNFDCDPTKPDIVQPLVMHLSTCARFTIVCEPDELGPMKEVGELVMECFRLLVTSFVAREAARRKFSAADASPLELSSHPAGADDPTIKSTGDAAGADNDRSLSGDTSPVDISHTEAANLGQHPYVSVESSSSAVIASFSREMRNARLSKLILSEAATRFCRKPKEGLQYLQVEGILPTPLTPVSVAAFLRVAPGLPKENTGAFLGELGKDNAAFEADSRTFHREVLECYVRSFELRGQTVLNCMRIFLSAFRLPGEAQQIDRILVSFSEYCHENCEEGASGLLENPEVTYLLSFSIIMLNTDLHNPNIRPDRKMTSDQFVKNNAFYGTELKQTKPIPKEFLEGIYKAISESQIRTERNDLSASWTPEMWMDLQLQSTLNPERGVLFTTFYSPIVISHALSCKSFGGTLSDVDTTFFEESYDSSKVLSSAGKWTVSALVKSKELFNADWIADLDLFDVVCESLLVVPLSPFLMHRCIVAPSIPTLHLKTKSTPFDASGESSLSASSGVNKSWRRRQPSQRAIQNAIEILLELLEIVKIFNAAAIADAIIILLAGFAGVIKEKMYGTVLRTFSPLDFQLHHFSDELAKSTTGLRHPQISISSPPTEDGSWVPNNGDVLLETLLGSLGARAALRVLLFLAHQEPSLFGTDSRCWKVVWFALSSLRDCAVLPPRMVLEADADLLPPQCRAEFEGRLKSARELYGHFSTPSDTLETKTAQRKKSTSMLSLVNIGEALFGSKPADETNVEPVLSTCSRWDDGYEGEDIISARPAKFSPRGKYSGDNQHRRSPEVVVVDSSSSTNNVCTDEDPSLARNNYRRTALCIIHQSETNINGSENGDDESNFIVLAFGKLRQLVNDSGIAELVGDARFFGDNSLIEFISAIISTINCRGIHECTKTACVNNATSADLQAREAPHGVKHSRLGIICDTIVQDFDIISASSTSWLEMVLVEAVLRNRDRFVLLWPALSSHYRRTLLGASEFTYALERRVTGIFKIATRMLSREQLTAPILDILRQTFTFAGRCKLPQIQQDESHDAKDVGMHDHDQCDALNTTLLAEVAGQVSAGVWRLITQNVSVLPNLRLEQWQILFDLIAVGAAAGGYSSIKAFEAMAWLLHEPRLRAEVPVFCVVGLRPLLCNPHAPMSVSVGAIELLSHLHTRLEVLVSEGEKIDFAESGALDETPLLWESCWTPILQALADGVSDGRVAVRAAAADTIAKAILEQHVLRGVPPGVMVNTLGDIVVPTVLILAEALVDGANVSDKVSDLHLQKRHVPTNGEDGGVANNIDAYVGDVLSYDENILRASEASGGASQPNFVPNDRSEGQETRLKKAAFARKLLSSMTMHDGNVVPVVKCLSALCDTFTQQLSKLAGYPSFDKLWLRLLHLFGFFLGAPHGFDHGVLQLTSASVSPDVSHGTAAFSRELGKAVKFSKEILLRMVENLCKAGVFKDRSGLWSVTHDTVQQFKMFPGAAEDLMKLSEQRQ